MRYFLPVAIVILALVDAAIHFSLDIVVFHGQFFLNTLTALFLLNALGYLGLVILFILGFRTPVGVRRAIDLLLIVYIVVTFAAWLAFGHPNPLGLGYASKAVEAVLVLALVVHAWELGRTTSRVAG